MPGTRAIRALAKEPRWRSCSPPGLTASHYDTIDFIRKRRVCYRFAFGIVCTLERCPFVHDHMIRPGYYQHMKR